METITPTLPSSSFPSQPCSGEARSLVRGPLKETPELGTESPANRPCEPVARKQRVAGLGRGLPRLAKTHADEMQCRSSPGRALTHYLGDLGERQLRCKTVK